jgi:hypothetical protein
VLDDDQIPHYSAGWGELGAPTEYLVDDVAISYEVAQQNDDTAYTTAQYERLADEVAKDCRAHGIPPVMLDLRAGQFYPVPTGITRHDRTANGKKLGKSDPGKMFDDARFIALLRARLEGEDDMALSAGAQAGLEEFFGTNYTDTFGRPWPNKMAYLEAAITALDAGTMTHLYEAIAASGGGAAGYSVLAELGLKKA